MSNATHLPSFDEAAITKLAYKIRSDQTRHAQGGQTHGGEKRRGRPKEKHLIATAVPNKSSSRGVKRDAHGRVKGAKDISATTAQHPDNDNRDRATLLQEILALGGSQHDFDLVADAVSEDSSVELNSNSPPDHHQGLREELAQFAAGLGLENVQEQCIVASDVEMEAEQVKVRPETSNNSEDNMPKSKNTSVPSFKILVCEPRPDWHNTPLATIPSLDAKNPSIYRQVIINLKKYGDMLLASESDLYASKNLSASSSHRFLSTIMLSGTLSDKVSALTLVVQESPVHNRKALDALLTLARKRSRGQAITAIGALKDLLGAGAVLPSSRRLRSFAAQSGLLSALQADSRSAWTPEQTLPKSLTKRHLMIWAFEDWLKDFYFELLRVLESWCNDEVDYARSQAVTFVYELLKEKPEQESNLLRLLVNKLGDPQKKIASRASYLLLQLESSHPLMKSIIVESMEYEVLLRPGQSTHAKYYTINTLNQTVLSIKEEGLARRLLKIYFDLFVALLENREKPSMALGHHPIKKQDHLAKRNTSVSRSTENKDNHPAKQVQQDSVEKLISAVLTGVNRALPFSGTDSSVLETHLNTLFQITHSSNFNTGIQALMLIEQLVTTRQVAIDRFYRTLYESLLDPRLITSSKHTLYFNLLFRALRSDLNVSRVKAFAKRLLQVDALHQPPFISGSFHLLKELEKTFPGLRSLYCEGEHVADADEEVFFDADKTLSGEASGQSSTLTRTIPNAMTPSSPYDGRKRDPAHSDAYTSCLWELVPYSAHFHPSVALFASSLLNNTKSPPKPDLASHTLPHFLDRFVYRNAKTTAAGTRGSSIMQPLPGGVNQGILLSNKTSRKHEPLNSEAFWRKKIEDVSVDEVFFHTYFNQVGKTQARYNKTMSKSKSEEDENEDEIWQALVSSRPEVEGDSDEASMLSDLEISDQQSEITSPSGDDEIGADGHEDEWTNSSGDDSLMNDEHQSDVNGMTLQQVAQTKPGVGPAPARKDHRYKKRLKDLPTFAAAADYADMMDEEDDEDSG